MNYWHMQLHPANYQEWTLSDVREILNRNIIGCSGEPVSIFYQLKVGDLVLVRHGGQVLSLVKVNNLPRQIDENERNEYIWFDHGAEITVLEHYENKSVSGNGWFIPKTLMPVAPDNETVIQYIQELYSNYTSTKEGKKLTELKSILSYKKQIILQGPPGTGKTRLAKKLANTLVEHLDIEEYIALLKVGYEFELVKAHQTDRIKVEKIEGNSFTLSKTINGEIIKFTIEDIRKCYQTGDYLTKEYTQSGQEYALKNLINYWRKQYNKLTHDEQISVIQFHPSYSYDDFVRGIVAVPNEQGEGIIYEAEDKIIASLSKKAHRNYILSNTNTINLAAQVNHEDYLNSFYNEIMESLRQIDSDQVVPKDKKVNFLAQDSLLQLSNTIEIFQINDREIRFAKHWRFPGILKIKIFNKIVKAALSGFINENKSIPNEYLPSSAKNEIYYRSLLRIFLQYYTEEKSNILKTESTISYQSRKNYVLIIDEINRANLSSVLGELIYALEYRGKEVETMYEVNGSNKLVLPPNLYIIGTMNTADRSVGHIDYAIRRRFAFVDVLPKKLSDDDEIYFNTEAFHKISALFNEQNVSKEFEIDAVKIGHSYFIVKKEDAENELRRDELFNLKMQYEIKPILLEYEGDGILVGQYEGMPIKDYIKSI